MRDFIVEKMLRLFLGFKNCHPQNVRVLLRPYEGHLWSSSTSILAFYFYFWGSFGFPGSKSRNPRSSDLQH
jgi:hypothetical protein